MSMRKNAYGSAACLVCLVALAAFVSCKARDEAQTGIEEAAINVRVERPAVRPMEAVIEVQGNLEPKKQADVVAEVSGTVVELFADVGDEVEAGQLLAKIEDKEYVLGHQQSRASYRVARSDYLSTKELYREGMKSKSEYEQKRRAYLDSKANLEMSEIRLDNTEVRTPIGGTVVSRSTELYKPASTMEPLFRVADLEAFLLAITVTEDEVAKIGVGQEVRVRIDAVVEDSDEFPFSAEVRKIEPMVDPQTGTVEIEIAMPHPGRGVRAGMFARLKIVTEVHDEALVVPRRALSTEDESQVWKIVDGGARLTNVKTGLTDAGGVEIVSGLSPDDLVIVEGQSALTPKSRLNIVNGEKLGLKDTKAEPRKN